MRRPIPCTSSPARGKQVKLILTDADELEVRNKNGEVLAYTAVLELGEPVYTYTLVPNETYSYVATKDTWYHAKKDFTLSDVGSGLTMAVEVTAGDWLTELTLDVPFDGGTSFTPAQHTYSATYWDATVTPSAQAAQQNEDGDSLGPVCVIYPTQSTKQPETPQQIDLSSGKSTHLNWAVLDGSAHENTLTFRASRYDTATKITSYTDYQVTLKRSLSLESLSASANGVSVPLRYQTASGTQAEGYTATQSDYTVLVPAAARSLDLKLQAHGKLPKYGDEDVGYLVDGRRSRRTNLVHKAGIRAVSAAERQRQHRDAPLHADEPAQRDRENGLYHHRPEGGGDQCPLPNHAEGRADLRHRIGQQSARLAGGRRLRALRELYLSLFDHQSGLYRAGRRDDAQHGKRRAEADHGRQNILRSQQRRHFLADSAEKHNAGHHTERRMGRFPWNGPM